MKTEVKHSPYSASAAYKWINCPASLALERQIEESVSEDAEKGSLAHAICELKVTKKYIEPAMTAAVYTRRMNKLKKHELYEESMQKVSEAYLDVINDIMYSFDSAPYIAVEKRVDYSKYAPEGFGTADCIIIHGSVLWVIDYKNGSGVKVEAEENPQLMLYGLGAYEANKLIFYIK